MRNLAYNLVLSKEQFEGFKKGFENALVSQYGQMPDEKFWWGYEPEKYPCLMAVKPERDDEWDSYHMNTYFLYEEDVHRYMGMLLSTKKPLDKEPEKV